MKLLHAFGPLLLGLSLISCGGGDSGSRVDGPPATNSSQVKSSASSLSNSSSAAPKIPAVTLSGNSVEFTSNLGMDNPPPDTFEFTLIDTEQLSSTVYVFATMPETPFFSVSGARINEKSASIQVAVSYADVVGLGVHKSSFLLSICEDNECKRHLKGSPQTIDVTYSIGKPSLTFAQPAIAFDVKEGTLPKLENQLVLLSSLPKMYSAANPVYEGLTTKVSYNGNSSDWLRVIKADLTHLDIAVTKNLPAGNYTAELEIGTTAENILPVKVPVTLKVTAGQVTSDTTKISFDLNDQSTLAEASKKINLSTKSSASAQWTATSNQDWLDIGFATGASKNKEFTVQLNKKVANLKNGKYSAVISIAAGSDSFTIPVELTLDAIQFDYASAYFSYDSTNKNITVYGEGFSRLKTKKIYLNSTEVKSYRVTSDTELSIALPELGNGNYELTLDSEWLSLLAKVNYSVIPPETFADQTLHPDSAERFNNQLIYEPVSQKLFFFNSESGVSSYTYTNGQWSLSKISLGQGISPARGFLSIDGKVLYVMATDANSMYFDRTVLIAIDIKTAAVTKIPAYVGITPSISEPAQEAIAISDDTILFRSPKAVLVVNLLSQQKKIILAETFGAQNMQRRFSTLIASADRSYVEIGVDEDYTTKAAVFNKATQALVLSGQNVTRAVNADNSMRLVNGKILDAKNNELGAINGEYSLYTFDYQHSALFANSFQAGFYRFALTTADNGIFNYDPVQATDFMPGSTSDAFILSPNGSTVFTKKENTIAVGVLK